MRASSPLGRAFVDFVGQAQTEEIVYNRRNGAARPRPNSRANMAREIPPGAERIRSRRASLFNDPTGGLASGINLRCMTGNQA